MTVTIDGSAGITTPGVTDTGNLSVTGTSSLIGAVTQTGSSTAASFIPTGSSVPTNGMYLSAANTVNIATNSTNQVAISSTGIVTGTAGNLMLIQGTSQASTSGTSIDFTGIPSWVKRITVIFNGVSTNSTNPVQVQIGSGSYTTSGYISTGARIASTSNSTNSTVGFLINTGPAATDIISGILTIANITSNTWVASFCGKASTTILCIAGGDVSLSGTLDRLRIIGSTTGTPTDTFDAGSINIQYE